MSRIDEALRRAQAQPSQAAPTTPPADTQAPEDVPWAFRDGAPREAAPAPGETAKPAAAPAAPAPVLAAPVSAGVAAAAPAPAQATAVPHVPSRRKSDAPVLPAAGDGASMAVFRGFSHGSAEKLIVTPSIRPTALEQYRKLAATLHHAQTDRGIRVVMVASALVGEGKTLTATNLALTLAESYQRNVLLIDGDLRRPSVHEVFQVANDVGLTDGLKADADQKLSLVQVSPRMTLLTAGRPDPDPMSLLTSSRMRRVIEEAAGRFDWVVIDTPPVALITDANLLAAMVDVAVLVVRAKSTPYDFVQRAVEALGRERVIGVVLNRVDEEQVSAGTSTRTTGTTGTATGTGTATVRGPTARSSSHACRRSSSGG
jgi:capsular exopolysaccharide synthesis family protein